MAGPSVTLGSPWPPLAIRLCFIGLTSSISYYRLSVIGCQNQSSARKPQFQSENYKLTLRVSPMTTDQADAEWIVIRTQLRGHNDTPFGRILYVLVTID
jgi:hypothetical protein